MNTVMEQAIRNAVTVLACDVERKHRANTFDTVNWEELTEQFIKVFWRQVRSQAYTADLDPLLEKVFEQYGDTLERLGGSK